MELFSFSRVHKKKRKVDTRRQFLFSLRLIALKQNQFAVFSLILLSQALFFSNVVDEENKLNWRKNKGKTISFCSLKSDRTFLNTIEWKTSKLSKNNNDYFGLSIFHFKTFSSHRLIIGIKHPNKVDN